MPASSRREARYSICPIPVSYTHLDVYKRQIPSYPVVDLLAGVTIYNAGWSESLPALVHALLWGLLLYAVSLFVLKRKVELL